MPRRRARKPAGSHASAQARTGLPPGPACRRPSRQSARPRTLNRANRAENHDREDSVPTPDEPADKAGKFSLFYKRHEMKITRAEVVILFLALIRTITAYYQLKTRPGNILPAEQVEPLITGSLAAALSCLVLTLLSFSARHRVMHAVFALAIISLILVKIFLFTG
jgi:hypothetical protein